MKKTILTLSLIAATCLLHAQVLYGTAAKGGTNNGGAIVKLVTATNSLTADFSLDGPDGYNSSSTLMQAFDGKLYGMTFDGGSNGVGVIFSYDISTSTYLILKNFDDANGGNPIGSLMQASDGKLYGMTYDGGSNGVGVIFSYDISTSTYLVLKNFDDANGGNPNGSLMQASDGKLYGMTSAGGSNGAGVIFSYDIFTAAYTKLHDFNRKGGYFPAGSFIQASDGKLYGMTSTGGSNGAGVIFSYDISSSAYTKLLDFDNVIGSSGYGNLTQASDGKLYGMTGEGGLNGYGVIFSYNISTSAYTKLLDFNGTNGASPFGSLIQASDGKLYGMTYFGGSNDGGVIFSYDISTSAYIKLLDFNYTNGSFPVLSLIQASDGKLYGMTSNGGSSEYGYIFSYDPTGSVFHNLRSFGGNATGIIIPGNLVQASDGKLYGMTGGGGSNGNGVIFSYDLSTSIYTKLYDFNYTNGSDPSGNLIQATDGKLYGMTGQGGSKGGGVIFSYDPSTSIYAKLYDFDYTNGSDPSGNLIQATDGKLYGMTGAGGSNGKGVIFSYDIPTSVYVKLKDFDYTNGSTPLGSLMQASDGKLYGMTASGGRNGVGVIYSFDPSTSAYKKLKDFNYTNGSSPYSSLMQASDGKLYGTTYDGGSNSDGVIFSFDPSTSTYMKLKDFDGTNGARPRGSLMQASDGKLYGMTSGGGSDGDGVCFSYNPSDSTFTKLADFNGINGSYSEASFIEIPAGIQISIQDKSVIEGDKDRKFIFVPVTLSESPKKVIRVNYTTQNNTAKAGSDYYSQSGTLVFPPGLKRILLPIRIKGDQEPEANETFSIILSHAVNATIADSTASITILDDDASALNASKAIAETMHAMSLSPNPAQDKVKIMLTGFAGNVIIQLSSFDGRILQEQKLKMLSSKPEQQQLNVSSYANGTYLVTAIDEKGNRQTGKLVIDR